MKTCFRSPLVSVVIVNFNGIKFIEECLNSVLRTSYSNFEVILVDNASTDGSLACAKKKFGSDPRLKIVVNRENCGPSLARNTGFKETRGEYVVFLDNDTKVDSEWLQEMVNVFEADPTIGASQSKLLLGNGSGKIDSCGHFLSPVGFPFEIGVGEVDSNKFGGICEIFGAKSAAMTVRRSVFERVGLFDSDYFIYGEETDLCWRIWLRGYRVVLTPRSVVQHFLGGTITPSSRYLIAYQGSKNNIKNLIKNLEIQNLLKVLPLHLMVWFIIAIWFTVSRRPKEGFWVIRGIIWNLVNFKRSWRDRLFVQKFIRRVPDRYLMPKIMRYDEKVLLKAYSWLRRL